MLWLKNLWTLKFRLCCYQGIYQTEEYQWFLCGCDCKFVNFDNLFSLLSVNWLDTEVLGFSSWYIKHFDNLFSLLTDVFFCYSMLYHVCVCVCKCVGDLVVLRWQMLFLYFQVSGVISKVKEDKKVLRQVISKMVNYGISVWLSNLVSGYLRVFFSA